MARSRIPCSQVPQGSSGQAFQKRQFYVQRHHLDSSNRRSLARLVSKVRTKASGLQTLQCQVQIFPMAGDSCRSLQRGRPRSYSTRRLLRPFPPVSSQRGLTTKIHAVVDRSATRSVSNSQASSSEQRPGHLRI